MKNKKKDKFIDDGRVIANMDVEGMPHRKDKSRQLDYNLSKEEKRHLIWAGYKAALPILIVSILGMTLAMFLIKLWLN